MVKNSDIASIIDISLFKTKYPQSISLPQQHPILNIIIYLSFASAKMM